MKVIFDLDGTMTDFHAYIKTYTLPWFYKKYGLRPVKPDELEPEEILDLQNVIQKKRGCTPSQAKREAEEMMKRYWLSHRFLHYSLLTRFRPGCSAVIRKLRRFGFQIEIYTSRAHTASHNMLGRCARFLTTGQLWLNGVWVGPSRIHYFHSDSDKLEGIFRVAHPLVFDDKPDILDALCQKKIPAVCIAEPYNEEIRSGDGLERITEFRADEMEQVLTKAIGKNMGYWLRAARSDLLWKKISCLMPVVRRYFNPVILNARQRIFTDEAVLYAPNHRSTLDPLVILSVVNENIHWAALLRFFQAKDSIFNNSKNSILCRLTAWLFCNLEYFPIDRKTDNPNANNFGAIQDMTGFLRISEKVGIFAEGTTRRPKDKNFGTFDKSIIVLAKRTNAWIQPVTVYWAELGKRKKRPVINFGAPFKVGGRTIQSAMNTFLEIQQNCLQENMDYAHRFLEKTEER